MGPHHQSFLHQDALGRRQIVDSIEFSRGKGYGLLAKDMFPSLDRGSQPIGVGAIRQADIDRVQVGIIDQRLVVFIDSINAELDRGLGSAFPIPRSYGNGPPRVRGLKRRQDFA
jgi:hypothetical protein